VISRAPRDPDPQGLIAAAGGVPLELCGVIPHDEMLTRIDVERRGLLDLPADAPCVRAVDDLLERLAPEIGLPRTAGVNGEE